MSEKAAENTDVELWREREDDYYANSIHRTAEGAIGINVGGYVIVKTLADWHALARPAPQPSDDAVEKAARAICKSGKFETGQGTCALRCLDQLGSARSRPCAHATAVHGDFARAVLAAVQPDLVAQERAGIVAWLRSDPFDTVQGKTPGYAHVNALLRAADAIECREDKRDD